MPCYQSSNLPSGVTTTGRTGYATEAECLQACKEGACCEGVTCTVKPQCQCQCTTGRCCGPDTITVRPGESYPAYRVESREACLARGGTWRCGAFGPQSIEGYVGSPVCPTVAGTPEPVFKGVGTTCEQLKGACCETVGASVACSIKTSCECVGVGKTFKGVGTTCTGSCSECLGNLSRCYCYCTANGGKVPRFINVTVTWQLNVTNRPECSESYSRSVTLSPTFTTLKDGDSFCYGWEFTDDELVRGIPLLHVSAYSVVNDSQGYEFFEVAWQAPTVKCVSMGRNAFSMQSFYPKKTANNGIGEGVCFLRHVGKTESNAVPLEGNFNNWLGTLSWTTTITGMQA